MEVSNQRFCKGTETSAKSFKKKTGADQGREKKRNCSQTPPNLSLIRQLLQAKEERRKEKRKKKKTPAKWTNICLFGNVSSFWQPGGCSKAKTQRRQNEERGTGRSTTRGEEAKAGQRRGTFEERRSRRPAEDTTSGERRIWNSDRWGRPNCK